MVSRYNATVTDALLDGAIESYVALGGDPDDLTIIDAPGAFELVTLADAAAGAGQGKPADARRFAGIVAIGCIVKGETIHDEVLAHSVTKGLLDVSLKHNVPVTNAVLTVSTQKQALARAGGGSGESQAGDGNKGAEAMEALLIVLHSLSLLGCGVSAGTSAGTSTGTRAKRRTSARPDKFTTPNAGKNAGKNARTKAGTKTGTRTKVAGGKGSRR